LHITLCYCNCELLNSDPGAEHCKLLSCSTGLGPQLLDLRFTSLIMFIKWEYFMWNLMIINFSAPIMLLVSECWMYDRLLGLLFLCINILVVLSEFIVLCTTILQMLFLITVYMKFSIFVEFINTNTISLPPPQISKSWMIMMVILYWNEPISYARSKYTKGDSYNSYVQTSKVPIQFCMWD
jgi:hypothetical protein